MKLQRKNGNKCRQISHICIYIFFAVRIFHLREIVQKQTNSFKQKLLFIHSLVLLVGDDEAPVGGFGRAVAGEEVGVCWGTAAF